MKEIRNKEPKTFCCSEPDLCIYDEDKNKFYVHPNRQRTITFNLPKGKFFTENKIGEQKVFIPYKEWKPLFPKKFLDGIKILVRPNDNKATIYRQVKTIVIDPEFAFHDFKPVTTFTLSHELHHFIFFPENTELRKNKPYMMELEKLCDEGAVNYMLGNGWNPTQIKLAKNLVLSNKERGLCVDKLTVSPSNNHRRC